MPGVGDVLAAKYRLESLLGAGGMGHVYRAVNEDIGRAVAIKVLRSEHATNAPIVERFLREARAANLVRHPNVVDVLDIGRADDGAPFIVQELLEGQDLMQYTRERGGKLSLSELEAYLVPVIEAVAEAHAHGVVHRDLKPENVFLAEQGAKRIPKLLDFGISKIRHPSIRATEVAMMMGTPAYMAPEQVQGTTDADTRTDVWSLGIMMFELLSGQFPYSAMDSPQLFVAIATKDAPLLADVMPGISAAVSRITERCLQRSPDQRFADASELAAELRRVLGRPESLRPARSAVAPLLVIPDLELPTRAFPAPSHPSAAPTAVGGSAAKAPAPAFVPPPPPRPLPSLELDMLPRSQAAPSASRIEAAPSPGRSGGMSGVMMSGPSASVSSSRRVAYAPPPTPAKTQDLSFLVGLGVVGLVAIFTTALLTALIHRPDGFAILSYVTKPTPTTSLIVHGGLGLVALAVAGRSAAAAVKQWRDYEGARGGALGLAVFAGALFFAAIELLRAAG